MNEIISINLLQFALIYLLLIAVLLIMRIRKINQTHLLFVASLRMTIQLAIASMAVAYIFQNPAPLFTVAYLALITGFAIVTALSHNKGLNPRFQIVVGVSLAASGLTIICFFVMAVAGINLFYAKYTIPVSGMIMGNAMTGVSLGLRVFNENITARRLQIDSLLNIGVTPKKIFLPFVNQALETALIPTLNSMAGMGIISLPGMMTGQTQSGAMPIAEIFYQAAIIIAVCAVTSLSVFCSLYFGYRTLYNRRSQIC